MGTWEKSHEEVIFGYEAELWDRYPHHVVRAFFAVSYTDIIPVSQGDIYNEDEEVGKAIEAFAHRWGGLSDETFLQVLKQAQDRDRLVAIFAVGHSSLPQAADVLAPFLNSASLLERYAAAIVLGLRRDERSLPVLEEYILADEPVIAVEDSHQGQTTQRLQPEAQIWFGRYRPAIAGLFATFGPASVGTVLRKAFLKYWEEEQKKPSPNYRLPDGLLYALGKRGDFGVLQDLSLPDFQRHLALIYLALGALNADERFVRQIGDDLYHEMLVNRELHQEVVSMCTTRFGLTEQEAQECVAQYGSDYQRRRKPKRT